MDPTDANLPYVETVRWAYRYVLGRDPEGDSVLWHWASLADGRLILSYFVESPEAQAHREAGTPAYGNWIFGPLSDGAITAAYLLRFNQSPTPAQLAEERATHPDLASFRRAFLGSAEVQAKIATTTRPKPQQANAFARLPIGAAAEGGAARDCRFTVLGETFTLRGHPKDQYWRSMVEGPPDPSMARLGRLVRAAFPDGGAGRVLVDAGANIGTTSLVMAKCAPYHADLLAFEADERNLPLLQHNLASNGLDRAQALGLALAERDGTARLRFSPGNTATSGLIEAYGRTGVAGSDFKEVPVRRLDTVLAAQDIGRLDLLKIDVEGGETPVMLGASEAIARDKPIIFLEFNVWTQMTAGARNPMDVLEEWHAVFAHMVAFDRDGRPIPIRDRDGLLWVLHTVMMERGCVDDLVLCDNLHWLENWA